MGSADVTIEIGDKQTGTLPIRNKRAKGRIETPLSHPKGTSCHYIGILFISTVFRGGNQEIVHMEIYVLVGIIFVFNRGRNYRAGTIVSLLWG